MSSFTEILATGTPQGALPYERYLLSREAWTALSQHTSLTLLGMWADTTEVHAAFMQDGAVFLASVPVEESYPALSPSFVAASWFERMIHDLWGHVAEGGLDTRAWLDHGRWPVAAPMSPRPEPRVAAEVPQPEFLDAEGDSLHVIPVGPVHAGIIEPGHFRFHAQGETVVRLQIRLGYTHKGTLALMRGKSPRAAAPFAARISGDSTVAHAIAFARAAEAATGTLVSARAHALRGVMAEIERIANHLGDIGAITNDAAFAWIHARCGYHREMLLRATRAAFGHRLMMDLVLPGGVATTLAPGSEAAILQTLDSIRTELPEITRIYDNRASLTDRVEGTGIITPQLAHLFAAGGYVGRASGRRFDARVQMPYPPYDALPPTAPLYSAGDVDARVRVRMDEVVDSIRLLRSLLADIPEGDLVVALPATAGEGVGIVEGFRGEIIHWVKLGPGGAIAANFARDPSWLHWPLLEAAIENNIVADFPLCNKSVNASYSGVDL